MPSPTWRHLIAAPHRPLFLAGTAQIVVAAAWWLVALTSRHDGTVAGAPIPIADAHAWFMLQGTFPFFVFGFLFTALPNWVEGRSIDARAYLGTAACLAAGTGLVWAGALLPALVRPGLILHCLGWILGASALLRILRDARHPDKRQPWLAWATLVAGGASDVAFLAALVMGTRDAIELAITLAIWAFLLPLFLAVCHRMLPFFTSRVIANYVVVRPYGPLWAMVVGCLMHALLISIGLDRWSWLVDLPLAALALWFSTRWGIARALRERLLAMLHIGFLWCALAFALHGVESLLALSGDPFRLGLAPLHALGMGFFGAVLIAMASRVILGHSGRALRADGMTWAVFWSTQLATLARILADITPLPVASQLMVVAALLWLVTLASWAWRYAPWLWRPRADGKPG